MYAVKRCSVCDAQKDMRVVEEKWNMVDAQGNDSAVFVKYYYCETCKTLACMENVETNGRSFVHNESVEQA